ncbi:uncharacterized protein LOC115631894 [Scaptodrosophila lebanonensis]|uniref:Uncharacterized protein LOC115631894 n=1 Tax=Drosophila lebanonensis TaxID=7225 RepID=A0A6J2UBM7_DROLE|nr:uncharacterized protein LOC115631894 [Scaptodrosophila lebanonensis]
MEKKTRKRLASTAEKMEHGGKYACTAAGKAKPSGLLQTEVVPLQKFSFDLSTLPAVPQVNGFERGYTAEALLDVFENQAGEHLLYVKFKNLQMPELVPLQIAGEHVQHLLPSFYEEYVQHWNKRQQQQQQQPQPQPMQY